MAYSKTPEGDTHSVKRIPAIGSPFIVPNNFDSEIPQTLNFYNCFPHKEKQYGQDPKFTVRKREPYISALSATTGANVSSSFAHWALSAANDDEIYFARNDTYYRATYTGSGSVTITSIGTYTSAHLTAATLAINASSVRKVVAVNGTNVSHWSEDGSAFANAAITPVIVPSAGLVYLNGYLFAVADNRRIYNSGAGGDITTWNTTDFIDAELYPDLTLYIAKHRNYLIAFGENSTEFFYDNAVEVGSPLARQDTYAARIGCHIVENAYKATCNINDDIYFIGKSPDDTLFLAVVQDFKVKPIESKALDEILNNPTDTRIYSIETWTVNNQSMVLIKLSNGAGIATGLVYNPDTESWWTIELADIGGNVTTAAGDTLVGNQVFNRTWSSLTARYPFFMSCGSAKTSATVNFKYPDKDGATSITATLWTDVIDMDVNRWKHVYKVSAVGDYGNNVLTLSYCNNQTYNSWTTLTPTKVQSTLGAKDDLTWTNLGQFRQFSLRMQMVGSDPASHTGFELAYNLKMV